MSEKSNRSIHFPAKRGKKFRKGKPNLDKKAGAQRVILALRPIAVGTDTPTAWTRIGYPEGGYTIDYGQILGALSVNCFTLR